MTRLQLCILLAIATAIHFSISTTTNAREWYVAVDGSGDMPTIQAAIDTASPGDEVVVGPGYYSWSNQGGQEAGMICFWTRDMYITVRSEMGPESTTLDAEYNSRVIYCHGQNWVTIDGFTITQGEAPDFGDNVGGGFFTHIPGETVRNCIFINNRALHGGGISCVINDRFFTAEDCVFINNHAENYGGAISVWNGSSQVDITDCVMEGNTAGSGGAGVIAFNCHVYLDGCTFYDNKADDKGSAVHVHTDATVDLWQCTISENGHNHHIFSSIGTAVLNLDKTIVSFNSGDLFGLSSSTTGLVGCCNIYGNSGGDALPPQLGDAGLNFSADPLFCGSTGSHNYYLTSLSPCWPSNRPDGLWCQVIGAYGLGCGSTATVKKSWGAIKDLHRR